MVQISSLLTVVLEVASYIWVDVIRLGASPDPAPRDPPHASQGPLKRRRRGAEDLERTYGRDMEHWTRRFR